jgi:cardiolipin hydrolase
LFHIRFIIVLTSSHFYQRSMEEIEQLFIRTLADGTFSSSERQEMRQLISLHRPNRQQRDWLRSRLFDLARTHLKSISDIALLNWLEVANKALLEKPSEVSTGKVYFSPGDDCLHAILQLLNQAHTTLHLCVFTISDDRITRAILHAQHRGVDIRLISDNEKLSDDGSDIRQLARAGLPIRIDNTPNHMHHKFAIADQQAALTGSYNWTRSAALYNHENILVTQEPAIVAAYTAQFDKLWEEMVPFDQS